MNEQARNTHQLLRAEGQVMTQINNKQVRALTAYQKPREGHVRIQKEGEKARCTHRLSGTGGTSQDST